MTVKFKFDIGERVSCRSESGTIIGLRYLNGVKEYQVQFEKSVIWLTEEILQEQDEATYD